MVVSSSLRLAVAALLLAALSLSCFAQPARSAYDPASQARTVKPKDGFVDFTLNRINASDKDYGQCIDQSRTILLEETINRGYFWSNIVALGLLGCLFLIIIYQHRNQARREWAAAGMLAQYAHSLARSDAMVEQATKENHGLKDALVALREAALRTPSQKADLSATQGAIVPSKTRAASAPAATPDPIKPDSGKPAAEPMAKTATAPAANQMGLFTSDSELIMKLNLLEQQLARSEEDNKELRRRIADGNRRLETEQQKNRQLKGA